MKGIALGGVARANGASRGGARGDGTSCAVHGGGEAVWDGGSNGSRARRKEKLGRRRCGVSWREEEAPARKGVGLGETREAWRRSNRRRGRPVCEENRRRRRYQSSGKAGGRRKLGSTCLQFVKSLGA